MLKICNINDKRQFNICEAPYHRRGCSFFVLASALYIQREVLVFGTISIGFLRTFSLLFPIALAIYMLCFCLSRHRGISISHLRMLALIIIPVMLSMLINVDFRIGYFSMAVMYLNCMLLMTIFTTETIYRFIFQSMYVISLYSLVCQLILQKMQGILQLFPMIENVIGHPFYFMGLSNVGATYALSLRNYGPFREPGVFQSFIIIALIYGIFCASKKERWKTIVLLLALLTTKSTTGYIAALFLTIAYFGALMRRKDRSVIFAVGILAVAGCFYIIFFTSVVSPIFDKLMNWSSNISTLSRLGSNTTHIEMMLRSPLFGNGISNVSNDFSLVSQRQYGVGITSCDTLFAQGARFGIPFFVLITYRYYNGLRIIIKRGPVVTFFVFLSYVCILITQSLQYTLFFALPLFALPNEPITNGKAKIYFTDRR